MAKKPNTHAYLQPGWSMPLQTYFDLCDWHPRTITERLDDALIYLEFLEDCNRRLKEIVG